MKAETILKGTDLLKSIESVQTVKASLGITTQINLSSNNTGTMISIKPNSDASHTHLSNNTNTPLELKEAIREETIRFIQRCKRHCDRFEHEYREELEDLQDEIIIEK